MTVLAASAYVALSDGASNNNSSGDVEGGTNDKNNDDDNKDISCANDDDEQHIIISNTIGHCHDDDTNEKNTCGIKGVRGLSSEIVVVVVVVVVVVALGNIWRCALLLFLMKVEESEKQ